MESKGLENPRGNLSEAERKELLARLLKENPGHRIPGDPFILDDPLLKELEVPNNSELPN